MNGHAPGLSAFLLACACGASARPAAPPAQPEPPLVPERVIQVKALPARAHAAGAGELELRLRIASGYHVMSDRPSAPQYVATTLRLAASPELQWGDARFPPAQQLALGDGRVATFAGELRVRVPFRVAADAAPGARTVAGELEYQACTEGSCLFPARARFDAPLAIEPLELQR